MTALFLILVSAATDAVVNILTKLAEDNYAVRLLIVVFRAVIVAPALFFVLLLRGAAVSLLVATAFVHACYELLLVKSYENGAGSAMYHATQPGLGGRHRAWRHSAAERVRIVSLVPVPRDFPVRDTA